MTGPVTTSAPQVLPVRLVGELGARALEVLQSLGRFGRFLIQAITYIIVPPFKLARLVVGIFGGYLVGVELLGLSPGTYFGEMQTFVDRADVMTGFWKSLSFGVIVTWVCTYKGYYCGHGAEGVARATTQAVVLSSVLILVWDYFLGSVLP